MKDWSLLFSSGGPANDLVKVSRFFGDNLFITKQGHLGAALSVRGVDPATVTDELLQTYTEQLTNALRSLPEEFRMYQYLIKRDREPIEMSASYPSEAIAETVRIRNEAVQAGGLYCVDLVWVFVYESQSFFRAKKKHKINAASVFRALMSDLLRDEQILMDRVQAFIDETRSLLDAKLMAKRDVFRFLRRLGNLTDASAFALEWTPDECIDHFVMDSSLTCERDGLRIGGESVQILSTKQPLSDTSPNLMREVFESKCGVIVCLDYKRVTIQEANTVVTNAKNHFEKASYLETVMGFVRLIMAKGQTEKLPPDAAAQKLADEASEVLKRLASGDSLGHCSTTVLLHSPDASQVREAAAATIRTFGRFGGSVYRETYNALNAYRAMLPGGAAANYRMNWMLQSSVADMALMYAPAPGEQRNNFLNREYLLVAETNSQTPYFLNLHWNDVCNLFMSGVMGSGKSACSNAILAALQKYEPRTLIMDIGGSYKNICRQYGGSYVSLDFDGTREWSINPFSLPGTKGNKDFLETFVRLLLVNSRYEVTYKDNRIIHEAVNEIYEQKEDQRRLGNLKLGDDLKEVLYSWIGKGPYADVFDNVEDKLNIAKFQVFDFSKLENYPQVIEPLLFYMFRRDTAIVEDPALLETFKILWCDEAWQFLLNDTCRNAFVKAAKTRRKHNAGLSLVTQSSADLAKVGLLDVVTEVCPTKIFLSNPSADFEAYAKTFHLNAAEVKSFRNLIPKQQLMIKKAEEQAAVLNLRLSPIEIALYGNSPYENVRRLAAIEKYGHEEGLRRFAQAV